jgi:hypothetical protein
VLSPTEDCALQCLLTKMMGQLDKLEQAPGWGPVIYTFRQVAGELYEAYKNECGWLTHKLFDPPAT